MDLRTHGSVRVWWLARSSNPLQAKSVPNLADTREALRRRKNTYGIGLFLSALAHAQTRNDTPRPATSATRVQPDVLVGCGFIERNIARFAALRAARRV
jgi:hypothetical protein